MRIQGLKPPVLDVEDNINNHKEVSLNDCSQNGGNLYWAPYYNRNLNMGPNKENANNTSKIRVRIMIISVQGFGVLHRIGLATAALKPCSCSEGHAQPRSPRSYFKNRSDPCFKRTLRATHDTVTPNPAP